MTDDGRKTIRFDALKATVKQGDFGISVEHDEGTLELFLEEDGRFVHRFPIPGNLVPESDEARLHQYGDRLVIEKQRGEQIGDEIKPFGFPCAPFWLAAARTSEHRRRTRSSTPRSTDAEGAEMVDDLLAALESSRWPIGRIWVKSMPIWMELSRDLVGR